MSEPLCPTCDSPLDPAHAPVARVVGARVVTYCSTECADNPDSAPDRDVPPRAAAHRAARGRSDAPPADALRESPISRSRMVEVYEPDQAALEAMRIRPRRKKTLVIALATVIVVGGMALAIIQAVSPSSPSRAVASETSVVEGREPADAADASREAETPEELLSLPHLRKVALAELERLMQSKSPRVSRVAAMAMARTGDQAALDLLRERLPSEESQLNQIQIASALARAGDDSGLAFLKKSLQSDRRDVRLDSARALVELGDDTGRSELLRLMNLRNHRLGAAGLLARLGDEKGLEVLRKEAGTRGDSEESRLRALVALGRAGDRESAEPLREVLQDARFNVGAADALATLGDKAAVPALSKQLGLSGLRVRAALAIAQLGADVDTSSLALALTKGDEAARVSAAEAVLILSQAEEGPK